jgi:signal transduction histidine kinase/ActR/RegA family two-component response regulator
MHPAVERLLTFLDRWAPAGAHGVVQFRARVVAGTSLYISLLLLIFTPIWWSVNPGIGAGCVILAAAMLGVGPIQHLSGSVKFGANLLLIGCYLLEAWALALTGGSHSPFTGVAWVPVLYAGVVLGYRGGITHAVFVSTAMIALFALDPGAQAPMTLDPATFSAIAVPPAAMTCALVLATIERYSAFALQREAVARERAERANRAKSEFLGIVSHELRSPLAGILGAAELLERRRVDDQTGALITTIAASGRRLSTLVEDLLDLRVAEAGQLLLVPTAFSPGQLAAQVVAIVDGARHRDSRAGTITLDIDASVPDRLTGDPSRLHQVLLNLVSNAVRYGEGSPVHVRMTGQLRVEVTDHGPGLPPADIDRVFEPFVRLDASYRRETDGTGLGLAISRRLVHAMNGDIGVFSRPGDGATFWFQIPLDPALEAATPDLAPEHPPIPLAATHARSVLVVDDQDSVREVFVQMFEALGHRVTDAPGVLAALDACDNQRFDAIFLDISMPGVDGVEGARRFRARPDLATTALVALTANASADDRAHYLAAGFDDVVPKPARLAQLRQAIERATDPSLASPDQSLSATAK